MAATILYGNEWYGDTPPTTGILPGQSWIQPTSGAMWRRNTGNLAWIPMGNISNRLGRNDAGRGRHHDRTVAGRAKPADPDQPGLPRHDHPERHSGGPADRSRQVQKWLYDQLTVQVRGTVPGQYRQSGTTANVAMYRTLISVPSTQLATAGAGVAIPLPTFLSDGIQATQAQLLAYGWDAISGIASAGLPGLAALWEVGTGAGSDSPSTSRVQGCSNHLVLPTSALLTSSTSGPLR